MNIRRHLPSIRQIVRLLPKPRPVHEEPNGHGARWRLWRDMHIGGGDGTYLYRIYVVGTPFGSLLYHEFEGSDPDPHCHDHPFHFVSLLLEGSYDEEQLDGVVHRRAPSLAVRPARTFHRIDIGPDKATTLVWTTPRFRDWGFLTPEGWIPWRRYLGLEG